MTEEENKENNELERDRTIITYLCCDIICAPQLKNQFIAATLEAAPERLRLLDWLKSLEVLTFNLKESVELIKNKEVRNLMKAAMYMSDKTI